MRRLFIEVAIAAFAFSGTSAVLAQQVSTPVAYQDLDLSTGAGRSQLDRRIAAAVTRVCGTADPRDLDAVNDLRKCQRSARKAAIGQAEIQSAKADAGRQTYTSLSASALPHTPAN